MFTAELTFLLSPDASRDACNGAIHSLLGALRHNGQILGSEFPLAAAGDKWRVFVMLPRDDALDKRHRNKWVKRNQAELNKAGVRRLKVRILGEDPNSATACECEHPTSYVLFTNYLSLESPLRCGACWRPIPLYTIPPTDGDEFYSVLSWKSDYQACDTLQMNCGTGERFGIREMSALGSKLTQEGRAVSEKIMKNTGKSVYYFLFHYVQRTTREKEESRLCPSCGGEWRLANHCHIFDFRCDRCHLLSTISPTIRRTS